jgi:phosphoribosyl-AMP cyclohydrolase / phosphoribosyl-ATP pyrophosphohydrolase
MPESAVKFDAKGLIVAVAQDRLTGQVRMVAWMNREALERTLETGRATFFSRTRGRLWEKGETSGHVLAVHEIHLDCDGDTLLLLVDPAGPSCHTGRPACFFRRVDAGENVIEAPSEAEPFLQELESVIRARQSSSAEKSYTRSLLDGGAERIAAKLGEEAAELARAVVGESPERVASEAADVLYHVLVALRLRGVALREVLAALAGRAGTSGHAEKAGRTPKKSRV